MKINANLFRSQSPKRLRVFTIQLVIVVHIQAVSIPYALAGLHSGSTTGSMLTHVSQSPTRLRVFTDALCARVVWLSVSIPYALAGLHAVCLDLPVPQALVSIPYALAGLHYRLSCRRDRQHESQSPTRLRVFTHTPGYGGQKSLVSIPYALAGLHKKACQKLLETAVSIPYALAGLHRCPS